MKVVGRSAAERTAEKVKPAVTGRQNKSLATARCAFKGLVIATFLSSCSAGQNEKKDNVLLNSKGSAGEPRKFTVHLSNIDGLQQCESGQRTLTVSYSNVDFDEEPSVWMMGPPADLKAREISTPNYRSLSGRPDRMLNHESGGYLSNEAFTIQCRDLALMGMDRHFVRCQVAVIEKNIVARFDVPSEFSGCEGFIADSVISRLSSLG